MEVDNARRRIEQQHMVHWIVDQVVKGITPQQVTDNGSAPRATLVASSSVINSKRTRHQSFQMQKSAL